MTIEIEELQQITEQVWELIMQSQIAPSKWASVPTDVAPQIAYVELTGAYNGTVALRIDNVLVRSAAATMFDLKPEEVTEGEMDDTARELANMVGGNIKCLVDQPTQLGLPQLMPADRFDFDDKTSRCRLAFEHQGAPFQVSVYDA